MEKLKGKKMFPISATWSDGKLIWRLGLLALENLVCSECNFKFEIGIESFKRSDINKIKQ
jgi:hypothetical protein